MKERAIYLGFNTKECESRYKCPVCGLTFGGWEVFFAKENKNGTNHYCPTCETELDGLE